MKKIIYLFVALMLLNSPAFADNKARVKVGSVSGVVNGDAIQVLEQGDFLSLSLPVEGKKGTATVTALIPVSFSQENGSLINLYSVLGEEAADNPGEIALGFTSTRTRGENSVAISATENTVVTGKLKVISFDTATSVLKFVIRAKATPFNQADTTAEGSEPAVSTKNLPIRAAGTVTLPIVSAQ